MIVFPSHILEIIIANWYFRIIFLLFCFSYRLYGPHDSALLSWWKIWLMEKFLFWNHRHIDTSQEFPVPLKSKNRKTHRRNHHNKSIKIKKILFTFQKIENWLHRSAPGVNHPHHKAPWFPQKFKISCIKIMIPWLRCRSIQFDCRLIKHQEAFWSLNVAWLVIILLGKKFASYFSQVSPFSEWVGNTLLT